MKPFYYLIAILSFLIISCGSNNEKISTGDDLIIISQKLKLLQTDFINESSDNLSQKYSPKKVKQLKKSIEECSYEIIDEEYEEGVSFKLTIKFFDKNKNPITDCEIAEISENFPINYGIEQTIVTTGSDFSLNMVQYTTVSATIKTGLTSATYNESIDSDIILTLQIGETVFNSLEGSYLNIDRSFSIDQNTTDEEFERLFEETEPSIELKYILGLDANGNDYHFNLTLTDEDFNQSEIEKDYDLLNLSNEKVGTINYILNFSGSEEFNVYDLGGNLVE